jgi:hypothetical protein
MTLVSSSIAFAAPDENKNERRKHSLIEYEIKKEKTTGPQPVQPPAEEFEEIEKETYFFPHQSAFSMRTGAALNFKELNKKDGDKKVPILLGFKFMLHSENSKHQEYGLDLLSGTESVLYVNGGYKYIIDHTSSLRPYYKIGAALRFDQGDRLETPFDFKSYSLVLSAGLEELMKDPHSFRLDLDVHLGEEDFLAMIGLGWSWAY